MSTVSEKDIEDLICDWPDLLLPEDTILLGRQVVVPHGIIDILAWNEQTYIIELKSGTIKEKDVGQVLRYTNDIRKFLFVAWGHVLGGCDFNTGTRTLREQACWDSLLVYSNNDPDRPSIQPMLVGKSIDRNALSAARGARIDVRLWEMDENKAISFAHVQGGNEAIAVAERETPDWAKSIIRHSIERARESAEDEINSQIERLFSKVEPQ